LETEEALRDLVRAVTTDWSPIPVLADVGLLPFQNASVRLLQAQPRSAVLDATGLGKSVTALMALRLQAPKTVLILCPKFLRQKWLRELARWAPKYSDAVLFDSKHPERIGNVTLTTWDSLARSATAKAVLDRTWDFVIGDEAHAIKNRNAQRTVGAFTLKFVRGVLLTATPLDRNPADSWALLHFMYPNKFTSYWRFRSQFVLTDKDVNGWSFSASGVPIGVKNEATLADLLAPYYIRRVRADAGIPEPFEDVIPMSLSATQQRLYDQVLTEVLIELSDGTDLVLPSALARASKLNQVVQMPAMVDPAFEPAAGSKGSVLVELIESLSPERCVVYAMYRTQAEALGKLLTDAKLSAVVAHGGMNDVDERVHEFTEGKYQHIVITQVATSGQDMQVANHLIFVGRPWSAIINEQAEGRIPRIGQTRDCVIHTIVAAGTVDDDVERARRSKRATYDATFIVTLLKERYRTA